MLKHIFIFILVPIIYLIFLRLGFTKYVIGYMIELIVGRIHHYRLLREDINIKNASENKNPYFRVLCPLPCLVLLDGRKPSGESLWDS